MPINFNSREFKSVSLIGRGNLTSADSALALTASKLAAEAEEAWGKLVGNTTMVRLIEAELLIRNPSLNPCPPSSVALKSIDPSDALAEILQAIKRLSPEA